MKNNLNCSFILAMQAKTASAHSVLAIELFRNRTFAVFREDHLLKEPEIQSETETLLCRIVQKL